VSNIIRIEFLDKKSFPKGIWLREPDFCQWVNQKLICLAIRDMTLGVWRGFVGVDLGHFFFAKSIEEILDARPEVGDTFLKIYGGVCFAGNLPPKYKDISKGYWWLGIETSHGGDLVPLLELDKSDTNNMLSRQTYKDFRFIRRETNKLAKYMSGIK
jgi:hypothetical protein